MRTDKTPLSIGLFETNQRLSALLRTILDQEEGHRIKNCREQEPALEKWLGKLLERMQNGKKIPYNLIILDICATEIVGHIYKYLEQLVKSHDVPIVLLTDPQDVQPLPDKIVIIPVFFQRLLHVLNLLHAIEMITGISLPLSESSLQEVLQWQKDQYWMLLKKEQERIDQRLRWMEQRQIYIERKRLWLYELSAYLNEWHQQPDPQYEWLNEQQDWLQEQMGELYQQNQRLLAGRRWLDTAQTSLNEIKR